MEELKSRGNDEFGRGNYRAALKLYQRALQKSDCTAPRARAVLFSNRAACHLALDEDFEALRAAEAAVAADPTFEKAHVRCGSALERIPGRRADALAAYRRVAGNELAQPRIAVLEVPRVVGEEGVSGIEQGSLDPRRMRPFDDVFTYMHDALTLHERLDVRDGPDMTTSARVRNAMCSVASLAAGVKGCPLLRMALRAQEVEYFLEFDALGSYVQLSDVSDDGRRLPPEFRASVVPILPVSFAVGSGGVKRLQIENCTPLIPNYPLFLTADSSVPGGFFLQYKVSKAMLDLFIRMLDANATLVSEDYKASLQLPGGFRASILTPVCVNVPQVVVFEKCAFPGCTEEVCSYRCSKCMLVRYCGSEHSTAHWQEHKRACRPASERPFIELVETGPWNMWRCFESAEFGLVFYGVETLWPLHVAEGLAVVKVCRKYLADKLCVVICDQDAATVLNGTKGFVGGNDDVQVLEQFLLTKGRAGDSEYRIAYCDADVSRAREGSVRLFLDKALNCIW
jgi:tetratricopeptide (TPR) repeat protein